MDFSSFASFAKVSHVLQVVRVLPVLHVCKFCKFCMFCISLISRFLRILRILRILFLRSFKHFNVNHFKELLYKTEIVTDPADDVDEYVRQYNDSISTVLDKLAPLKTVTNRRGKKNNTWLS